VAIKIRMGPILELPGPARIQFSPARPRCPNSVAHPLTGGRWNRPVPTGALLPRGCPVARPSGRYTIFQYSCIEKLCQRARSGGCPSPIACRRTLISVTAVWKNCANRGPRTWLNGRLCRMGMGAGGGRRAHVTAARSPVVPGGGRATGGTRASQSGLATAWALAYTMAGLTGA
jgi:hypothetical protein